MRWAPSGCVMSGVCVVPSERTTLTQPTSMAWSMSASCARRTQIQRWLTPSFKRSSPWTLRVAASTRSARPRRSVSWSSSSGRRKPRSSGPRRTTTLLMSARSVVPLKLRQSSRTSRPCRSPVTEMSTRATGLLSFPRSTGRTGWTVVTPRTCMGPESESMTSSIRIPALAGAVQVKRSRVVPSGSTASA